MGVLKAGLPRTAGLAWVALAISLGLAVWFLARWQHAHRFNHALAEGSSLLTRSSLPETPALMYAKGWLYEQAVDENAKGLEEAVQHYALAEASPDPRLAARAKFGLGNLYLRVGLRAADVAAGGSHVRALAQLDLAREAYRGALRLDPQLREARVNLELLERLSPGRRTQGWAREERQMSLRQGEEQGWAGMQEHALRGLP